jgi:hypothetical protein
MIGSMTLRRTAGLMFLALAALLALSAWAVLGTASRVDASTTSTAVKGTTDGWYDGRTVKFFYPKSYFCAEPPTSGAASSCELGADAVVTPRPDHGIPTLYVMTPLGFTPPTSTLQCPTVGNCVNHPSTIDLSRVLGPGTENAALPAHSHIVDVAKGGWWDIEVVGVTDLATWNQIVAGKSLDTVRHLQTIGAGITPDLPTNLFLFFNVQD